MPSASPDDRHLTTFARLLGRQPSEAEVARLFQVKDTLGIGDNDALWIVLLSLEQYDAQFRRYPALLQSSLDETLVGLRETVTLAAEAELRKAHRVLAEAVTTTALDLAGRQQAINAWLIAAWSVAATALLVGLSLTAGVVLASGNVPSWFSGTASHSPLGLIASLALRAPVGWFVMAAGSVVGVVVTYRRSRPGGKSMTIGQKLSVLAMLSISAAAWWAMYGATLLS